MGTIVIKDQPCLDQVDCCSSDARQVYENGTSFCFSCRQFFPAVPREVEGLAVKETHSKPRSNFNNSRMTVEEIDDLPSRGFKERDITKRVAEFFKVKVSYNEDGEIDTHYYPYNFNGKKGYKIRKLPKTFYWAGETGEIFGRELFAGGGKRLIITEGEIDAMSVAMASIDKYDKIYPVVSIKSAASVKDLIEHRDWINSFKEVVLMFDNDKAGKDAEAEALKIVDIKAIRLVQYPDDCKDANDVLIKHKSQVLNTMIWEARPWSPVGIMRKDQIWAKMVEYNEIQSIPFPKCIDGINLKTRGRRLGEITLFISGTGSGKSTMLREDILHLIETRPSDELLGVVSLEESPAETSRKLAGMALHRNLSIEETPPTLEDLAPGFETVFGEDRILILDHQGSLADGSIVSQLEYMILMGCKYLYIDHITILVSEGADGLTGNDATDKMMNDLLRLVKRHNVWIGLVSHLRKVQNNQKSFEDGRIPSIDDIRGSGSIKQISMDIIAFARNMTAESEHERNSVKMRVLKCRYTGLTGDVPGAYYNLATGRLIPLSEASSTIESFVDETMRVNK